jgi:hypothetical protein
VEAGQEGLNHNAVPGSPSCNHHPSSVNQLGDARAEVK